MRFDIMTLFPEMVMNGLETSIIGRAVKNEILEIEAWNIRDYAFNKHRLSVPDFQNTSVEAHIFPGILPRHICGSSVSGLHHIHSAETSENADISSAGKPVLLQILPSRYAVPKSPVGSF